MLQGSAVAIVPESQAEVSGDGRDVLATLEVRKALRKWGLGDPAAWGGSERRRDRLPSVWRLKQMLPRDAGRANVERAALGAAFGGWWGGV